MSENEAAKVRPVWQATVSWPTRSALSSLIAPLESIFSKQGLALAGLSLALFITLGTGWLRPPLSRDLGSFELSLVSCTSESTLETQPRFRMDSPGILMLAVLGGAFLATAYVPQGPTIAGGLVLSAGLLANAAAVLQQPVLIEQLQLEHQERQQMATVLQHASAGNAVARLSNGRVAHPPSEVIECGSSLQGWNYLLHGKWLILVGLAMCLFTARGQVGPRLVGVAAWGVLGVSLACVLCSERLIAEYRWSRSEHFAAAADYAGAREALQQALAVCPALQDLERTWYWTGKLDYLGKRSTPQALFFRAAQLANDRQHQEAAMLLDELHSSSRGDAPPLRRQSARILTALGFLHYLNGSTYDLQQSTDARDRLRSTEAAVAIWSRALMLDPERADCLLYRSIALAESSAAAAQVEEDVDRFLTATADRALQADVLATLGDAYFRAGQVQKARQFYEQSKQIFELPKDINFRARRGLLGV